MVRLTVQWTERALAQLQEIGAYIALEDPVAAKLIIERAFDRADRLAEFPGLGRKIPEFPTFPHRELVVPPCRLIYRVEGRKAWILFATRSERLLRPSHLI